MDRRAESDNHARKEQRARAAAKNVSAKFAFCFHSYISVLRREPWSRLTLREEGQVELLGRRLTNLTQTLRFCGISLLLAIPTIRYECS